MNLFSKTINASALLLCCLCALFIGCSDDNDDQLPGLYTEMEEISTYPGDKVWINGQVSNYAGLQSVNIECKEWNVAKEIALKGSPTVYNYSWQMDVPAEASFTEGLALTISVTDVNGKQTVSKLPIRFLPDTTAPWSLAEVPSQVSIDFDAEAGKGIWHLSIPVADDRSLASAAIEIPGIKFSTEIELSGKETVLSKNIEIATVGNYEATIALRDKAGNENVIATELVVMLAEDEDPIADYDQMYVVNADENSDDYVNGYYRYMDRAYVDGEVAPYTYSCRFYAPKDGTKILFVPTKKMDGDVFGTSPYVSSKLMNKRDYVVPVVIEKAGYYWLWIDIQNHAYSVQPYGDGDDAIVCNEDVWVSGTGFDFGDWGAYADPMTLKGKRYEQQSSITAGTGLQYYFYTAGWARVFRADTDGNWWFESASGACCTFNTDYTGPVKVIFDPTASWAEIKKVK